MGKEGSKDYNRFILSKITIMKIFNTRNRIRGVAISANSPIDVFSIFLSQAAKYS
jgi:hypothetical protein